MHTIDAVPEHLFAERTKDSLSQTDVEEINQCMQLIILKLEKDRDFPISVTLRLRNGSADYRTAKQNTVDIVRTKWEDAGYITSWSPSSSTFSLKQPIQSKKQKCSPRTSALPESRPEHVLTTSFVPPPNYSECVFSCSL